MEIAKNQLNPLSMFQITMINIIAVASLRSLPINAALGDTFIILFIIAALCFFIPSVLVTAELTSKWPRLGGLYIWIKEAFGPNIGFIVIWIQWTYNTVWYPTILTFITTACLSLINPSFSQDPFILLPIVLLMFWLTTLTHFFGIQTSSKISTFGAILGTLIPMFCIIILGCLWLYQKHPLAISFSIKEIIPKLNNIPAFIGLTVILFSLVGIEMSAVHAEDTKNPTKTYPKALIISATLILLTLLLGTLAIAIVVPQKELNIVSGVIDAFQIFLTYYHLQHITYIFALLIIISGLCSVSAWIIGPAKGLLAAAKDGMLPKLLQYRNKKGAPINILLAQGIVFSGLCSIFLLMPSINSSYWLLSTLTSQLALLNYIVLFMAVFKLRIIYPNREGIFKIPGGLIGLGAISFMGIMISIIAILLGFIPPPNIDIGNPLRYKIILIVGMLALLLPPLGITLYNKKRINHE